MLATIPYVDIRGYTPLELLFLYKRRARMLVQGAAGTFGGAASRLAMPLSDRASHRWLRTSHNPYLAEIELIAEAVGVPGAYTLNLCFEWGCTSGVWNGGGAPLLRRVLDWPFPLLGDSVVVAHQSSRSGDFFNVTWPGFSGVLQAMAPGRFAAALNQAPMRKRGTGLAGDWLLGRFGVGRSTAVPPSHLLRHVFETARDYGAAKSMLCSIPVAVPAIFTLSGVHSGEGCVIERTEDDYAVRELAQGRVCAANHFESGLKDTGHGWRARPIDSEGRLACAQGMAGSAGGFSWFVPPVANRNSRLAMTAQATGALSVLGTFGERPVTEPFELPN
jgi:hypothetical protein